MLIAPPLVRYYAKMERLKDMSISLHYNNRIFTNA